MSAPRDVAVELIDSARRAIPGAADALVEAVWPHAYRIAYCIVRNRHLAEDAAQETCAIVYRKIAQLRSTAAFRVWFYRIVTREAASLERRCVVWQLLEANDRCDPQPAVIERLDVERALCRLAPPQRTAVVLHYYAGLNSREIAAIMRVPAGSVRFHLLAARRKLRALLSETRPIELVWETADAF